MHDSFEGRTTFGASFFGIDVTRQRLRGFRIGPRPASRTYQNRTRSA